MGILVHFQILKLIHFQINRPRSTMDSIRVSEAPDTGSIPVEATKTKSRITATLFIKPYHHH